MAKKSRKSNSASFSTTAAGCVLDKNLARRDAKRLGLNKGELPNSIKEVISTLTDAGFEAYIVGGGVRDSLLGLKPKDFDAVTNATPNQIKDVFGKRCRIIGRRFQLCHVYSGRDMIEVATFRAPPKDSAHMTEDGMLMRDNVWGDIYQDVVRRDFSINALYYQPHDGIVYDFCGGLEGIDNRVIRLLGDTQRRVEEDPVRLLRALRFKAKLNFHFDNALNQQFNPQSWALLAQVSPHRLYDETQKMFTGGYLIPLLPLLFDYGALAHLLFYPPAMMTPLVEQVTINTDKRIGQGKSINPAFFYAAILWENYLYLLDKFKKNTPFAEAQIQAANKVMDKQRPITAMPKFAEQFIKDIWLMQPRLANPRKKNLLKLFENPRFRAGFDFLMLREQVEAKNLALANTHGAPVTLDDESTNGMGHWWAWFQTLNPKQQQQAIDAFDPEHVKVRFANILANPSESQDHSLATPKNRRERRRAQLDTETTQVTHSDWAQDANSEQDFVHTDAFARDNQQQLEKDQLRQLSLAHPGKSRKPAKSLWQVDADQADIHQADTEDDLVFGDTPTIEVTTAPSRKTRRRRDSEISFGQNRRDNRDHQRVNSADTHSTPTNAPARRRRRVPSSAVSILEQRMMAESDAPSLDHDSVPTETLNVVAFNASPANAETVLETSSVEAPKKKRTRKTATAKTAQSVTMTEVTSSDISEPAESAKPKRAPRPRKKAQDVTNESVASTVAALSAETQTLVAPITKPPAKRTRKRAIATAGNAE